MNSQNQREIKNNESEFVFLATIAISEISLLLII